MSAAHSTFKHIISCCVSFICCHWWLYSYCVFLSVWLLFGVSISIFTDCLLLLILRVHSGHLKLKFLFLKRRRGKRKRKRKRVSDAHVSSLVSDGRFGVSVTSVVRSLLVTITTITLCS